MRTVGRIFLWLFIGLLGTIAIGFIADFVIDYRSLPKIAMGRRVSVSLWDRGYVSATGTWVFEDTRQAFPKQTTEIKCYRDEKECTSAQAEITFGDTLSVQTERFRIVSWDNNTIIYTTEEPTCVVYIYTVTRSSERVTGQRRPKQSSDELCKQMLEQRVLDLSLRDGFQVWQQLNQEVAANTYPYMWVTLGLWWAFIVYRMFQRQSFPKSMGATA